MQDSTAGRWWHGAVLYQLYVRSWRDSDGDGYGDLGGIIDNLDYLSWLGVDGIWLSPTMPSPDEDWGYDVSGYCDVHPELGTLAELDRLIAKAAGSACGSCSTWCPTTPARRIPGSWRRGMSQAASTGTITSGLTRPPAAARRTTGWMRRGSPRGPWTTAAASATCTTSCPASRT